MFQKLSQIIYPKKIISKIYILNIISKNINFKYYLKKYISNIFSCLHNRFVNMP